jgi:hypothetical protein
LLRTQYQKLGKVAQLYMYPHIETMRKLLADARLTAHLQ